MRWRGGCMTRASRAPSRRRCSTTAPVWPSRRAVLIGASLTFESSKTFPGCPGMLVRMHKRSFIPRLAAAALALLAAAPPAAAASLTEALSAYRANRVAEAEAELAAVAADPDAAAADRAAALRELGRIDWLIRGETDAAAALAAESAGQDRCAT